MGPAAAVGSGRVSVPPPEVPVAKLQLAVKAAREMALRQEAELTRLRGRVDAMEKARAPRPSESRSSATPPPRAPADGTEALASAIEALRQELVALRRELSIAKKHGDEQAAMLAATGARTGELERRLTALEERSRALGERQDAFQGALAARQARIDALDRGGEDLQTRVARLEEPTGARMDLDTMARETRLEALEEAMAERNAPLEALEQGLSEALEQGLSERDGRIDALEQRLAERDARIEALERRLAEEIGRDEPAAARQKTSKARGTPRRPAAGPGDDLRRIKGIGPKLAHALHEIGVHTFAQIRSLERGRRGHHRVAHRRQARADRARRLGREGARPRRRERRLSSSTTRASPRQGGRLRWPAPPFRFVVPRRASVSTERPRRR